MKSLAVALLELRRSIYLDGKIKVPLALSRKHKGLTSAHWALVGQFMKGVDISMDTEDYINQRLLESVDRACARFVCVASGPDGLCDFLIQRGIESAGVSPKTAQEIRQSLPQWMFPEPHALWENDLKYTYTLIDCPDGTNENVIYYKVDGGR